MVRIASRTRAQVARTRPAPVTGSGRGRRGRAASCLATSRGSGRIQTRYAAAASSWAAIGNKNTPASGGRPRAPPEQSRPARRDWVRSPRRWWSTRPPGRDRAPGSAARRGRWRRTGTAGRPRSRRRHRPARRTAAARCRRTIPSTQSRDPGGRDQRGRAQRDPATPAVGQPGQRDRQHRRARGSLIVAAIPDHASPPARWPPAPPPTGRRPVRARRGSGRWRAGRASGDAGRPDRPSARSRWSPFASVGDGTDTRQPLRRPEGKGSRHSAHCSLTRASARAVPRCVLCGCIRSCPRPAWAWP